MVKVYVEGGGDDAPLKTACRRGFSEFLRKAGLQGRMPRIIACGSRQNAYDSFCTAIKNGEEAFLVVDSEEAVDSSCQTGPSKTWRPWQHLTQRDQWIKPVEAEDIHCHLMTQVMESWFIADHTALSTFFGQGFQEAALSLLRPIEAIPKVRVFSDLRQATVNCRSKKCYNKGLHSFKVLELLDPQTVSKVCPWAKRFIDTLKEEM